MVGQDPELPDENESSEKTGSRRQPKQRQSQVGKLWDAFGSPEEPVNVLPSAKYNNVEELKRQREESSSLQEAIKSGNGISDLRSFHKAPCARDSLLLGMGAGFGIGGVRAIVGGIFLLLLLLLLRAVQKRRLTCRFLGRHAVWPACSWAVYSFAATCVMSFEHCRRRRREEMDSMKQAVDMMREIKARRQRQKDERLESERTAAAEEKKRKDWTDLSNYKFWK